MLAVAVVGVAGFFVHKKIKGRSKVTEDDIGAEDPKEGGVIGVGLVESTVVTSDGYPAGTMVLEVQRPWSRKLVKGEKTVEVRTYELPKEYIGKTFYILETRSGSGSGSSLPDIVDPEDDDLGGLYLIGEVVFKQCKQYKTEAEFNKDFSKHQLEPNSTFAYSADAPCYGWMVKSAREKTLADPCPILQRVERSLFTVIDELPEQDNWDIPYEGGIEE